MKLLSFILVYWIKYISTILPLWNLEESAEDLLRSSNTHTYQISDRFMYELHLELKKIITRNGDKITHINTLKLGSNTYTVNFENVESFYQKYDTVDLYILCPRGSFHPVKLFDMTNITFDNWIKDDIWDLKCYYHKSGYFLIYYLMNGNYEVKSLKNRDSEWKSPTHLNLYDEIYDFKLKNKEDNNENPYSFLAIVKEGNYLKLIGTKIGLENDNEIGRETDQKMELTTAKKYSQGYFSNSTTDFYYMTYNNVSDFISGYSIVSPGNDFSISSVTFKNNEESPFEFYDDVEIKEMNFLSNNKYVYYTIYNKITQKTYHGILDVKLNKIMFNTDEEIDVFIPYSTNSMLAITKNTAYKICAINGDSDCVEDCSSGKELILDENGNKCVDQADHSEKYLLVPGDVYISECDLSIYAINEEASPKKCGLCRDIEPDKPNKLINATECLSDSDIPEGAEYYKENFKLLVCKSGYKLDGNTCVPHCFENCKTCTEYSTSVTEQHCIECKEGYVVENEGSSNCKIYIPPVDCSEENSKKCSSCNAQSNELGLCLTCLTGFKKVNYTILHPEFFDCLEEDNPLLNSFYYNQALEEYKPCYRTCKKCLKGGDAETNNCLECINGYMFRPGNNEKNNCVAYSEFYYMSSYNQYKTLNIFQCPEEAKYIIKDKKSCIDNCKNDQEYKYLYNGNCLKDCPSDTNKDETNFICKVDPNKCSYGVNDLVLENNNLNIITTLVKTYLSEFTYTDKHISQYKNENYTITIYIKSSCIKELNLEVPEIDFKECYTKVQEAYNIHTDLVIVIVERLEISNPLTFYSFYHPVSGEKLNADEICANDIIVVKENLNALLNENNSYYQAQLDLTEQGINIFDKNDPFYTDICYDFDNPLKKDIPLNDRLKSFYPDIELCDDGCTYEGINLEDMSATCNCLFNDISKNALIKDNELIDSMLGGIFDMINSSNIQVLKCFKYMFNHFTRSIGGWISLILIIAQIAMILLYFFFELEKMKTKLLNLVKEYLEYIANKGKESNDNPPKKLKGISNNKNNDKLSDNIIISKAVNNFDVKSNDIKIPIKMLEGRNKENNKVITYGSNKELNKFSKDFNIKKEETLNYLKTEKNNKENFFDEYLATSPDDMEYDDAIVLDKRKFSEHFLECLKEKQIIAHTFLAEDILKPRTMKIIVLILNFILYFVVNGLFFSESVISELYEVNEDEENFFSYFPRSIERIIYCTLVSIVIGIITDFFFVQEIKFKGILIREKNDPKILKEKIVELINDIKTRNIAFITTVSIILLFSFFYLLCFNYVYPYTQIEWIKSSITIVIIMQLLSVLKCLFESGLRALSFKFKIEKLYKISKMLD